MCLAYLLLALPAGVAGSRYPLPLIQGDFDVRHWELKVAR